MKKGIIEQELIEIGSIDEALWVRREPTACIRIVKAASKKDQVMNMTFRLITPGDELRGRLDLPKSRKSLSFNNMSTFRPVDCYSEYSKILSCDNAMKHRPLPFS